MALWTLLVVGACVPRPPGVGCASATDACLDDTGVPDTESDTDTDADCDADADADVHTGTSALYWRGAFETTAAEEAYTFSSATLGFGAYGVVDQDWACTILGELAYVGPAIDTCPNCVWAFDLGPVADSTTEGPHCTGFVDTIFADGALDTYFDWQWGFAPAYTYYGSDGTGYPLEETVFIDQDGSGDWGLFAFNYGSSFRMISGDATALDITAQATDGTYNIYYYYYR